MPQNLKGEILKLNKDGIEYLVFRPAHPMDVFVDHFMVARGIPTYSEERLFPNNEVELFFNLGDANLGQLLAVKPNLNFATSVLSGLRSSFLRIFPGHLFYIGGIRFTLFGFYHLFRIPATEIQDRNFQADDVLGWEINQLRQQLGEQTEGMEQIALMSDWIQRRANKGFHSAFAWKKIDHYLRKPHFLIKQSLPEISGYSHKHSVHLITKMCGLSPKMVHRIYRLRNIFSYPNLLPDHSWAQITYELGYSDQSHLIREFKFFTGFTPRELLENIPKDFALKQLR